MKRRDFLWTGAGALAAGAAGCTKTSEAGPPNFLFILTDQYRGDSFGAAGNREVHTPNLDRLAGEGVRFANAYVPQAVCSPSRASLLTGVFPTTHGLTDNVYGVDSVFAIPEYHLTPNYPTLLREAGYHTGYIGKWHLGETDPGLFDHWNGFNSLLPHWLGEKYTSPYRSDVETDDAVDFLERNAGRRFFLEVSYYPPHTPFEAPKRFHSFYEGTSLEPMEYYAACTAIDWNVGRLLDKLGELGLAENTIVIFTSDHGETFGRRPLSGHKRVGYEESARVPMLIRYPARLPAGVVYEGGVSTIDLMPTVLEAAGLELPPRLEGASRLKEMLDGNMGWNTPVFTQNITQPKAMDGPHDERMVRLREWKLILRKFRTPGRPNMDELFNLTADPGEQTNVIALPESQAKVKELAGLMLAWGRRINDTLAIEIAGPYAQ